MGQSGGDLRRPRELVLMLVQIVLGAGLVALTALIQAGFMLTGFRALQSLRTHERRFSRHHATLVIVLFVLYMFVAMIAEVALWAWVYYGLDAVDTFEASLYVSIGSFTTSGYSDASVAPEWRLLVVSEGACGMIMFGWIAALVIAAIQHFDVWPRPAPRGQPRD
jgi:Trk-type K+ transport system membrane component